MRGRVSKGDAALAAALAAWAILMPIVAAGTNEKANVWTFAVGLVIAAAFAARRVFPLVTGTVMMSGLPVLAALKGSPAGFALTEAGAVFGAYTLEAHRRWRPAIPIVAPTVGALLLVLTVIGHDHAVGYLEFVDPAAGAWFGSLFAIGAAAGTVFRDRSEAAEELRADVAALRLSAPAAAEARVEAERLAMAGDVEEVVHRLVGRIRPAVASARSSDPHQVRSALAEVRVLAHDALRELRAMLGALRVDTAATDPAPAEPERVLARADALTRPRSRHRAQPQLDSRWLPVVLLAAAGLAERLTIPDLPLRLSPTFTIDAPVFGEGVAYALTAISAAVFLLRDRSRLALSLAVGALIVARSAEGSMMGLQPTRDLLVVAAVFFASLHETGVRRGALFGAPAVAGWIFGRTFDEVPVQLPEVASFATLVVAGFVAGRLLRERWQHAESGAAERDALRRERVELEGRIRMQEREQVARELHDIVGHGLTVISVQAGGAVARVGMGQDLGHSVDDLERALDETLSELDRLQAVLGSAQPDRLQPSGVWVPSLLRVAGAGGARVEADLDVDFESLAPGLRVTARRLLEEAVTNAHRHGDHGWIRLEASEDGGGEFRLVVENSRDAGSGPLSGSGSGVGLRGMEERAALYCGRVTVTAGDGRWRVEAVLPYLRDSETADAREASTA